MSWILARELDQSAIRVIGDVPDQTYDDDRIKRIMQSCAGVIVVLPYRNNQSQTSTFIIREIQIACEYNLPIMIFYESRVNVKLDQTSTGYKIMFPSDPNVKVITVNHTDVFGPYEYDTGIRRIHPQYINNISNFLDCVLSKPRKQPYAFLTTRLKDDFAQARAAIRAAVENETGLPCLWYGDERHATNIEGIRESTRLLIKHATFVVADLSFTLDNPNNYNPSRAHEVGMAVAYRRPIVTCAQGVRRDPYFSASDIPMLFWNDESDLKIQLSAWIQTKKTEFSRRVYNNELKQRDSQYNPKIHPIDFVLDPRRRYLAPNSYELSTTESWLVAAGFGLIVFSLSQLVQLTGYTDALDLVPIIASIFVFVFSSDIGMGIKHALGRYAYLRLLVPATGLILLLVWALLKPT